MLWNYTSNYYINLNMNVILLRTSTENLHLVLLLKQV